MIKRVVLSFLFLAAPVFGAFAGGFTPSFSFNYEGKESGEFLGKWKKTVTSIKSENESENITVYTWTDPRRTLKVECTVIRFSDYDGFEQVLRFTNTSSEDSKVISNICCESYVSRPGKGWNLHYAKGNGQGEDDFRPMTKSIDYFSPQLFHNLQGRSSCGDMPFYTVYDGDGGYVVGIGWSGNWSAKVSVDRKGRAVFETFMPRLETYLTPGESFRTPSTAVMAWKGGDVYDGQNLFRRYMKAHFHPQVDGKPVAFPFSSSFNYGDPAPYSEYCALTADWAKALIHRYAQFGLLAETFWIDAGWYETADDWQDGFGWSESVGTWEPDKGRFPNGMREVADEIHKYGCRFILWWEPERVNAASMIACEHPEFLLSACGPVEAVEKPDGRQYLFNLGDPEAREWLTDYISRQITEFDVDIYRQDFNIFPEEQWTAADKPGRKGIVEAHYVEGLYRYWDDLLAAHPGLLIDNCASGGNRLDLELSKRSCPLWRSDFCGHDASNQSQTFGLNQWLSTNGTGVYNDDLYSCRSGYSSSIIFNWKITQPGMDLNRMRRILEEYKGIKPYYEEDFYPLTDEDATLDPARWLAYQLNRPEDGTGYIVAFRHPECAEDMIRLDLRGIDHSRTYTITDFFNGTSWTVSGADLIDNGFSVYLDHPRASSVLKYE